MAQLQGTNYLLDLEAQTITYHIDQDTMESQTISLSEMVELLVWLKSREADIRHMVQRNYPTTYKKFMKKIGRFYKGVDEDRRVIKVPVEVWNKEAETLEKLVRKNWLADIKTRREGRYEVEFLDNSGKPLVNHNAPESYDESDCPVYLVQQELDRMKEPMYWLVRGRNTASEFVKVASEY